MISEITNHIMKMRLRKKTKSYSRSYHFYNRSTAHIRKSWILSSILMISTDRLPWTVRSSMKETIPINNNLLRYSNSYSMNSQLTRKNIRDKLKLWNNYIYRWMKAPKNKGNLSLWYHKQRRNYKCHWIIWAMPISQT
jgi:hypothetical protein